MLPGFEWDASLEPDQSQIPYDQILLLEKLFLSLFALDPFSLTVPCLQLGELRAELLQASLCLRLGQFLLPEAADDLTYLIMMTYFVFLQSGSRLALLAPCGVAGRFTRPSGGFTR